jgi:hypothetical protein
MELQVLPLCLPDMIRTGKAKLDPDPSCFLFSRANLRSYIENKKNVS